MVLPFRRGDRIQAFDPVLGQWLNASILKVELEKDSVHVHWAGYTKAFDTWLKCSKVRTPEEERPLDRRRPIEKGNFPTRLHPKHLQKDDRVQCMDGSNVTEETVAKNDCFRGEVTLLNGKVVKYENLKECSGEGNDSTDNSVPAKEKSENTRSEVFPSLHEKSFSCFSEHSDDEPLEEMPSDNEEKNELSDLWPMDNDYESDIDDVLEKMKFEEALKDLSENQQHILKNQQEIKKMLSAIEGLLHQRLEKRTKGALQASILSSAVVSDKTPFVTSTPARVRVTVPSVSHSVSPLQSTQLSHTPPSSTSPGDSATLSSLSSVSQTQSSSPPLPLVLAGGNTALSLSENSEDVATPNSTSLANYNGPIPRELLNSAASNSTNCKSFVFKLMDNLFNKKELSTSSLQGGVRRYRGANLTKKTLSPSRMKNIFKAAKLRFPTEFQTISNTPEFKEAINMKCRKTVFKDS